MKEVDYSVTKSSGQKVRFSINKLRNSLLRSGADPETLQTILHIVRDELYQGIPTKEIYNRAFSLLKKKKSVYASKYKLKKAIFELGPTGFPFERFIASILEFSGYETEVGVIIQGQCVAHEVDVVARKEGQYKLIECKFHSDSERNCNVKIPLYIDSRFRDISAHLKQKGEPLPQQGWVVTNTRFTEDALSYGKCRGLYLLGWNHPNGDALKDRIDRIGLYPITVSTMLTAQEKKVLLKHEVVLCKQLLEDTFMLDHLKISEMRKEKILNELKNLCT